MPFPNPSTQWKPGQTGNPHGRPRKGLITDAAEALLQQPHPRHEGKTRAEVIAMRWVERAEEESKDLDTLLLRTEGKVPDPEPEPPVAMADMVAEAEKRASDRRRERAADEPPGGVS